MLITGRQIIGWMDPSAGSADLHAVDPASGAELEPAFHSATPGEVDRAMELAAAAAPVLRGFGGDRLGDLGDRVAAGLEAIRGPLLERCVSETGYGPSRLGWEFARTVGQWQQFAAVAREGTWLAATIDHADPGRLPVPKPDVRRLNVPLGPVVVFGASNFPFALSAAGGDTASALMAGCPVVVKGHPSHPGTCELAARVVRDAASTCGFPEGTFGMVQGASDDLGAALVQHPATAAVGFTGSLRGGRALFDLANARPTPVPFFGEMGSVNPQFVLPGFFGEEDADAFADSLYAAVTLGNGQFCTNPGLVFVVDSPGAGAFLARLRERVCEAGPAPLLNAAIHAGYWAGLSEIASLDGATVTGGRIPSATGGPNTGFHCLPAVAEVPFDVFRRHRTRFEREVFGPACVVVRCRDEAALITAALDSSGQLAASVHGTEADLGSAAALRLVGLLVRSAGRLIINGFPTGVESCAAMHHGGIYPAATAPHTTSIGLAAITRWSRPVALQNCPDALLPPALQDANPSGLIRTVDGTIQLPANQPGTANS